MIVPLAVVAAYLHVRAADQYASHFAFSVRADSGPSPVEFFGGLAEFASSGTKDSDVLDAYIQSQNIVERLETKLSLSTIFGGAEGDPVFSYDPNGTIEDLHEFWQRVVHVLHDPSTGLIDVQVRAFNPVDAQLVARGIIDESTRLVEDLSSIAQADTTQFARAELQKAEERLGKARAALTTFRSRTQIVDPTVDLQGQMGVLATLEHQLATALIDADILRETTRASDIRLDQADRRIAVIRARIAQERRKIGAGSNGEDDYAGVVSEFERLVTDREFAEQAYAFALTSYDAAQSEARRKSRYLATHIRPTLAQSPQYPERLKLIAIALFFLIAGWSSMVLIYYSIRDRR